MTMSLNVVMLASGAFGLLPNNPVTQLYQKVISEQIPYPFIQPVNSFLAQVKAPQIPATPSEQTAKNPLLDPVGLLIGSSADVPNDGSNTPEPQTQNSLVATQVSVILTDAFVAQSDSAMSATAPVATPTPTPTALSTGVSTGTGTATDTPTATGTLAALSTPTPTVTGTRSLVTPTGTVTTTVTQTPIGTATITPTSTETPFVVDTPTAVVIYVMGSNPANTATGVSSPVQMTVTFSEQVIVSWAGINCGSGWVNMPGFSGSGTTITFDPTSVPASSSCTVYITASDIAYTTSNTYGISFTTAP